MKKFLIIFICLLSSLSIAYMYSKDNIGNILNAQSAPTFQLPKGAKIVLGKYNNKEIVWDIGNNNNNGNYVLMSSKPIQENFSKYSDSIGCIRSYVNGNPDTFQYSDICPNTLIDNEINKIALNTTEQSIMNRNFFTPTYNEIKNNGTLGLSKNDRAFKDITYYINERGAYDKSVSIGWERNITTFVQGFLKDDFNLLLPNGSKVSNDDCIIGIFEHYYDISGFTTDVSNIRPFGTVKKIKIEFAANTAYTDRNWHNYSIDTSNLSKNNELNPNKLRIQSSLTASLQDIKNESKTKSISKIVKNGSVDLYVNANTGTNNKISVILYNEAGTEISHYRMLENTRSGTNHYIVDLNNIAVGKYQVAVINEEYDAGSQLPAESSPISNLMPLEIVEPHKLTYTKTPQSGASAGNDYEFGKNVNAGQAVGKVTARPTGVTPLTYSVETNGDNSYLNFEIDGLDSNNASSNTPLNVKIKSNAPDLVNNSLKAENYKFCITAVDANGDPVDTSGNPTEKVCTSFTVAKTTPEIEFDDPNQTKKSVAEAAANWNETATADPNTGTKITYSVSGGDAYLIEIDEDSGEITYKGNGGYGKVTIRATVDDDPDSGNDNYESAYTEKEIVIYREVDGSVTPHANSSSTTTPTFTASDSNVKVNGIIGTIKGTLGTPDTIGGTTTTYKYGLKTGGDASLFSVDPNTGVIKSTANLGVKSYTITVTVSDKWSTKDIPVTINVGVAQGEDLKFYESSSSNTVITTKSVKVTDTNVTVYATVKGSTNNNPVTYKIKDGSTNVIEVNPNSGAITIHGVGTVTIVAEKQGGVGQAKAVAELTFTVTAGEQEFIYADNAGNELPKQTDKYKAYEEVYEKDKTFQLYTAGNPTGSTVTYKLKNGSPTDVISVDSNGLVHILNASISPSQIGKVIVEATSHDPSGNYADKTIELPINIKKAEQTISFADVTYATNGKGKVTPVINEQDLSSNDGVR